MKELELPKKGSGQIFSVNFFGGAAYRPTPSEKAKALAVPQNSLKVKRGKWVKWYESKIKLES